jgi:hypothetical protein
MPACSDSMPGIFSAFQAKATFTRTMCETRGESSRLAAAGLMAGARAGLGLVDAERGPVSACDSGHTEVCSIALRKPLFGDIVVGW